MENTIYIIQFHNCGAVYTCQGKLVVDYQGHKPPNEIEKLEEVAQGQHRIIRLFRRIHISAPSWPFSDDLSAALEDIEAIEHDMLEGNIACHQE